MQVTVKQPKSGSVSFYNSFELYRSGFNRLGPTYCCVYWMQATEHGIVTVSEGKGRVRGTGQGRAGYRYERLWEVCSRVGQVFNKYDQLK